MKEEVHLQFQSKCELMEEKMESGNKKLETMISNLDGRINAILRMICKEKEEEAQASGRTPLLPTPPGRIRDTEEGNHQSKERMVRAAVPNPPRIDLPMFQGERPREWLRKCLKYFTVYQIPENQRMEVVEMYLEGRADIWYQGLKMEKENVTWEEFVDYVSRRFGDHGGKDIIEEFNKLYQQGSMREYQEKFEELRSLMLHKNPRLPESYFISSFVSGVKEEVKPMIKMMKPSTLLEAFEVALLQQQSLDVFERIKRTSSEGPYQKNNYGQASRMEGFKGRSTAIPEIRKEVVGMKEERRITPQEIQYRRNNHLCYKCGEKFSPRHQCKFRNLHFMLAEEEEEDVEF